MVIIFTFFSANSAKFGMLSAVYVLVELVSLGLYS